MLKSIEAVIYRDGRVLLKEPVNLKSSRKAIITILNEEADLPEVNETALLSEEALAKDWINLQEEEAWSHLQREW